MAYYTALYNTIIYIEDLSRTWYYEHYIYIGLVDINGRFRKYNIEGYDSYIYPSHTQWRSSCILLIQFMNEPLPRVTLDMD